MKADLCVVLMTSRSGSSMVMKLLAEHGLRWQHNNHNPAQQPANGRPGYRTYENPACKIALKALTDGHWPLGELVTLDGTWHSSDRLHASVKDVDVVKAGVEFWPAFAEYATLYERDVRFVHVYRDPEAVGRSLHARTGADYVEAVRVAQKRFDLYTEAPGELVSTDLLVQHQWKRSGAVRAVESLGLEFDEEAALRAVDRTLFSS